MKTRDSILGDSTNRLAKLIEDQERLLEIVRREKAELVRMDTTPPSLPTP
jgi:hypothetical protein